ncbi:hypothetical protein M436DRAFT_61696 [Aureobasidium namibiae CBS 147.97]|uniref:Uncharacterized protein n=1 Tax=Aureobasidium namibiae CBS 147.97 TaxID=1043004 RepID=A0A074WZQ0_9PEZI
MRDQSFNLSGSSGDMRDDGRKSTPYQMHNAYESRRMSRWLTNFDDVQEEEKVTIIPQSSLPLIPRMQRNPRQFLEMDLARSCYISAKMKKKIQADADADTQKWRKWILPWDLSLRKLKKRQHLANLRKNGHKTIAQQPPCPKAYLTNKSQVFRSLIARKVFGINSIKAFKKLKGRQRMDEYKKMLELKAPDMTPGMINLPDPATITTDLQTHCTASLPNKHACSLLSTSAIELLPNAHVEIWREAQRHFWRHNVFVVDTMHIKAVLSGINARIKSYIGMLHIDLEALDDLDNLTRSDPSHVNDSSSQSHEAICQQNHDLRRLMQECYNLTYVRIHVHTEWMEDQIQELAQAHRDCRKVSRCRHIRNYEALCMNTQRRVEHLTWLFCKSLRCKEKSVFIDVEQLGLDGVSRIFEVNIDQKKLDTVDKKMKAAWIEQREGEAKRGKKNSRALRVSAAKNVKMEVIDLT